MASPISDLAIQGGKPVRESLLPYGKQCLDDSDKKAVSDVLETDFITRGPRVRAFEEAVAQYVNKPYAVGFHTATSGLHAVMAMLGIGEKKKVAVPAMTFAATANSVAYCGGKIEFIDVDAQTLNIDINRLGSPQDYAAVYAVDFAGNPCDYQALQDWRGDHDVKIVADAAHSLGASYQQKKVGQLADISVFSFHPVKSVTAGEGGCVIVDKERQRDFLMMFRNHGIGSHYEDGYFDQQLLGMNYHLTEMQAALGASQLKKLDEFIQRRSEIAKAYNQFFDEHSKYFERPQVTPNASSAWHLYPLRLHLERFSVDRSRFLAALRAENIYAQIHYVPVYWHSYYQKRGFERGLCPVAEREFQRELSLPIFPFMTSDDQQDVFQAFEKLMKAFRK